MIGPLSLVYGARAGFISVVTVIEIHFKVVEVKDFGVREGAGWFIILSNVVNIN